MSRHTSTTAEFEDVTVEDGDPDYSANHVDLDIDVPADDGTQDEPATTSTEESKAKGPQRGDLPEGFVTPVGFAKIVAEKGLQKNKFGEVLTTVPPQMIYSYERNAKKDDPFPTETIQDSKGTNRRVVNVEKGLAWWERKNARTEERKTNAAAKADKKATAAATTATEAEASEPVVEAE
jgi:hypothetical protein